MPIQDKLKKLKKIFCESKGLQSNENKIINN